jgi:hypothetical protein
MKTIIEMAREAGGLGFVHDAGDDPSKWQFTPPELKAFEALVRADEREACAQLIESLFILDDAVSEFIAKAIRARGNT